MPLDYNIPLQVKPSTRPSYGEQVERRIKLGDMTREENLRKALRSVQTPDEAARITSQYDPMKGFTMQADLQTQRAAEAKQREDRLIRALPMVRDEQTWQQWKREAESLPDARPGELPGHYTPEAHQLVMQALSPEKPVVLNPGDVGFDPRTGARRFENPKPAPVPEGYNLPPGGRHYGPDDRMTAENPAREPREHVEGLQQDPVTGQWFRPTPGQTTNIPSAKEKQESKSDRRIRAQTDKNAEIRRLFDMIVKPALDTGDRKKIAEARTQFAREKKAVADSIDAYYDTGPAGRATAPPAARASEPLPTGWTEDDMQETMRVNGMTRVQVMRAWEKKRARS